MKYFPYLVEEALKRAASILPLFSLPLIIPIDDVARVNLFLIVSAPFLLISELGIFRQTCRDGRRLSLRSVLVAILVGAIGSYVVRDEFRAITDWSSMVIFGVLSVRALFQGFIEAYALFYRKILTSILSSLTLISSFVISYFLVTYEVIRPTEILLAAFLGHCVYLLPVVISCHTNFKDGQCGGEIDIKSSGKLLIIRFIGAYIDSRILFSIGQVSSPVVVLALSYLIRGCEVLGALARQGLLNRFVSRRGAGVWRRRVTIANVFNKYSLFFGVVFYAVFFFLYWAFGSESKYSDFLHFFTGVESLGIVLLILVQSPMVFIIKKSVDDNKFLLIELSRKILPSLGVCLVMLLFGPALNLGMWFYFFYMLFQTVTIWFFFRSKIVGPK